jgi:uncharacterized protein YecE (DUF72 family)
LETFIKRAKPMGEKLGCILIQLPPSLVYEEKKIERFVEDIQVVTARNYGIRFALEPRHKSWSDEIKAVVKLLRKANIALVFAQSRDMLSIAPEDKNITADFAYIRFHGPEQFAASRYGEELLQPWSERTQELLSQGLDVFVYFNNDINGHAIYDARAFSQLLAN